MARKIGTCAIVASGVIAVIGIAAWVYDNSGRNYEETLRQRLSGVLESAREKRLSPSETILALDDAVEKEWTFTLSWSDRPSTKFEDSHIPPNIADKINDAVEIVGVVHTPSMSLYDPGYLVMMEFRDGKFASYDDSVGEDRK